MNKKCILCGSETSLISHKKFGDFHKCNNCELISKDEKDYISKENEFKIYNSHNNSLENTKYVEYLCRFLDYAVINFTNGGKSGLDFGSGPSPVLANILKEKYEYDMDIYDLFYAPEKIFIGKKYDLVTSTEVIEHLKNPLEYFNLFANILKPNGILAVMTQFHKNDDKSFLDWHYIRDRSHISFYTKKTMEYICTKVGLKIIYTDEERYTTMSLNK